MKRGNPVFKNMERFNRCEKHKDRKKRKQRGYEKHKSHQKWRDYLFVKIKTFLTPFHQIN